MSCKTILPTNIDEIINALDLAGCEKLSGIKEQVKKIKDFNNPLKIDERFLDFLIDEYEAYRFIELKDNKRELVAFTQKNCPKLGTIGAIKRVFVSLGVRAEVIEWFESGKEPYVFDIDLSATNREITPELIRKLKKLVILTKNIRSVLDELRLSYFVKHKQSISFVGVGEIGSDAKMIDGYLCRSVNKTNIAIACVCEVGN